MQQELAATKQAHADQLAELRQDHAAKLTEQQAILVTRNDVTETELSEALLALDLTKQQQSYNTAQLQNWFDSTLAAADDKYAGLLSELSAAKLQHAEQMMIAEQQHQHQLNLAEAQYSADLATARSEHSAEISLMQSQTSEDITQLRLQLSSPVADHSVQQTQSTDMAALLWCEGQRSAVAQHVTCTSVSAVSRAGQELIAFSAAQDNMQECTACAAATEITAAQAQCSMLTAELSELSHSLTASVRKLEIAQPELVVHASTAVGRYVLACELLAVQQDIEQGWKLVQKLVTHLSAAVQQHESPA